MRVYKSNRYALEPITFIELVWEDILATIASGTLPQCPPCGTKDIAKMGTIMLHHDVNGRESIYMYFLIFENLYRLTLTPIVEVNPDCTYKYSYTYSVLLVGDISDDSVLLDNVLEK